MNEIEFSVYSPLNLLFEETRVLFLERKLND